MKRLHVHVAVSDLAEAIRFYSHLFAAEPVVRKDDYAKWMLDDPRVNFAISSRSSEVGIRHLGIQAAPAASAACCEPTPKPPAAAKQSTCCPPKAA